MDNKQISLEEQKDIQVKILEFVASFCHSNNIEYSLAYGTLLGAVRHKGYIPWDDDIDIMMTRDNYEKFRKIYKTEKYPLVDIMSDEKYPLAMGKIYDSRTYYYRGGVKRNLGLFIDIFPVDNVPDDSTDRQKWINNIKRLNSRNIIKNTPLKSSIGSNKRLLHVFKCLFIKIFCSSSKIHEALEREYTKYNSMPTSCVGVPIVMSMKADNVSRVFPREIFKDYTTLEFEKSSYSAIKRYDDYLRIFYGDYMQLPPVDQRVGKHDIVAYYK